ncbi:MAG TPA: thiol peroxidase [Planctomycetota bacterium]|nr:thiol peroxidase [Planctomycetota bacterium]
MATITFKGNPIRTVGDLPRPGAPAPEFHLVKTDLSPLSSKDLAGKQVVLNIFPSVDTSVCATSVRRFNQEAAKVPDAVIVTVSKDLPFALKRFCAAEGIEKVITTSDFRSDAFGKAYGTLIQDGPLAGLHARAVVVIGKDGKVVHSELVPEIGNEPDYEKALAALR